MRLTTFETDDATLRAGYSCPCGCNPSLTYVRGGQPARSLCCCGNEFVLGPAAEQALGSREGFHAEAESREAWGQPITAAWLVGPSVHPSPADPVGHDESHHGHHDESHHGHHGDPLGSAIDPVCGMRVDPATATGKGLHRRYEDVDYYFCAKGCYLDFGDDPERILDPSYIPSM